MTDSPSVAEGGGTPLTIAQSRLRSSCLIHIVDERRTSSTGATTNILCAHDHLTRAVTDGGTIDDVTCVKCLDEYVLRLTGRKIVPPRTVSAQVIGARERARNA